MCFLHLYNMIKIRPFPQLSIVEPIVEAFYWLSFGNFKKHQPFSMRLCLSLWLMQDSNWKGRVLWKLSGGLATILQNWISCNEQKMREAHITRRGTSFYLLIFIEKIINRKIEHSLNFNMGKMLTFLCPMEPRRRTNRRKGLAVL